LSIPIWLAAMHDFCRRKTGSKSLRAWDVVVGPFRSITWPTNVSYYSAWWSWRKPHPTWKDLALAWSGAVPLTAWVRAVLAPTSSQGPGCPITVAVVPDRPIRQA